MKCALRGLLGFALSLLRDVRTYKFVAIGVSTLVLAEGLMFVSVDLMGIDSFLSAVLITEVVLLINFLLNDRLVFGEEGRRGNPLLQRLFKYHVSRVLSIAVNLAVFFALNKLLLLNHLLAYFLAVVVAFGVNLLTSFVWVWRVRPVEGKEVVVGARLTSSTSRASPTSAASTTRRPPR
ncbi:MAG: GtrA family protein [Nitrososphaerota archaeon]